MSPRKIRKIAINTGGGDAPGLNAVLRSVALSAIERGIEVWGIKHGYRGLLEDEPGNARATDQLTAILQKQGMNEELAELLQSHFDRARDEQNLQAIAELGQRIAELYGDRRPDAAIEVLRSSLSWVPDHAGLLRALLERLGPEGEPRERAEERAAIELGARADDHRLAAAVGDPGERGLVRHPAREAQRVDERLPFAVVVDEAAAAERRPQARIVDGDDRAQAARGVALEVDLAVIVVRQLFEDAHGAQP